MSATSLIRITVLATAVALAAPAVYAAEDASMHEVYQAAEAGKFTEAQAMMDKVLRDHPNSAKAHFVEAELLGKQGRFAQARDELANAERLAPGLPFEKPANVQNLRNLIAGAPVAPRHTSYAPQAAQAPATERGGMPWGWLIVGAGLIGFIAFAVRFMGRRTTPTYSFNGPANSPAGGPSGNYANAPAGGYGGYGGAPGMQPYGGPMGGGGGLGSSIVGGLATGAAVGAGLAAGEALVHHFTDGDRGNAGNGNTTVYQPAPQFDADDDRLRRDDMGGTDFGVADSGSWDSGSGGGGGGDDDSWN